MNKIENFSQNMDNFVLVARKVKEQCITMKGTRINKAEFQRQKRILKEMLKTIEQEIWYVRYLYKYTAKGFL